MPGTSSHTKVRLSGKGVKRVNSYGSGDHYVHIKVVAPKSLNNKQKALIQVCIRPKHVNVFIIQVAIRLIRMYFDIFKTVAGIR